MHGEVPKQVLVKSRSRRRTYVIGLILIAVSALIPLLWFKRKGWWE